MASNVSNDTIDSLKELKVSSDVLEKLEERFKSSFSPARKNYQARLNRLTRRLESIELPDSQAGRELSDRIQSTIDDLTDHLKNGGEGPGKLLSPRFIGRLNFSKEIAKIRNLSKRISLESDFSDSNPLDSDVSGGGGLGHGIPTICGCPLCACSADYGHKSGEFNAVGDSNDNFGQRYGKWSQPGGKGSAVDISFAFGKNFDAPGLSLSRAKTLFAEALQVWSDYAPLNFREVADPGNGDLVDIRVTDKFIDGRSGTLAFAYYPKGGDITFDNGETWRDDLFLETAVHEIGHAIGLGHENGVGAIMNSSIKNRYSGKAFLLQDDINGVRNIYGSGKGSVRRLGSTPTPTPTPTPDPTPTPSPNKNLVVNGSFESSSVADNQFRVLPSIQGWTLYDGSGIQVERRNQFGRAADGDAWVELDSDSNSTMYQNIDSVTGGGYKLSFQYSPRAGLSADTNQIQVYWEGRLLDTVTKAGGSQNQWQTFSYDVQADDRRETPTIAFRAVGRNDKVGGFIDDVVLTKRSTAGATAQSAQATADPFEAAANSDALFAIAPTVV